MFKLNLDPHSNYILASTFGPDSMALLDMTIKQGVSPVVCFVNYHFQDSMEGEEDALKQYCAEHNLRLETLDTDKLPQEGKAENFVEWARNARYAFFEEMYQKYDAAGLLVAHTMEDLIEVYLTQKHLGKRPRKYGYQPISTHEGMVVLRPLLDFTRHELLNYDKENNVPFSTHMDVYEDQHVRDDIHRSIVAHLNAIEREQILDEIRTENDEKIRFISGLDKVMDTTRSLSIRSIIALSPEEFARTLIRFVGNADAHVHLKSSSLNDIRKMCLDPQPNLSYPIGQGWFIIKEYDVLILGSNPEELPYSYILEKPGVLDTPQFHLDFSNGGKDRGIKPEDYPLTIRTALPQDMVTYGGYLVPVRRFYIDLNLPHSVLSQWPVFCNKDGKVVYVPDPNYSDDNFESILELRFVHND